MSYGYLIDSMGDDKHFEINIDEFNARLKEQWSDAESLSTSYGKIVSAWRLPIKGISIRLNLWKNRETVSIEGGDSSSIAEIAVWYRSLVPLAYRLFLYSGPSFNNPIILESDTTIPDVVRMLSA
jgi:hypothetical protein